MPVYHCSKSEVQRSKGQNAIASSAYISRSKLSYTFFDKATGQEMTMAFDYASRDGLAYSEIIAPKGAPVWVYDREELWTRCELAEKRKDAETARKLIIALPKELDIEKNIDLVRSFALEHLVAHGMIADVNIHYDNEDNPHCHIQMTTRLLVELPNGEIGFGLKNLDWGRRDFLYYYRESVASSINKFLELHGHLDRVSHLSYLDSGIDLLPTVHEGPARHIKCAELRSINQQIMQENAAKIRANPELVFDKLSINKPVFTKEDIAHALFDVLNVDLKFFSNKDTQNDSARDDQKNSDIKDSQKDIRDIRDIKGIIESLNTGAQSEFMTLYSKVLASDKIRIVTEEDLKGRTLYALTKRLELEKRFEDTIDDLSESKKHCLYITDDMLMADSNFDELSAKEVIVLGLKKFGKKIKEITGINFGFKGDENKNESRDNKYSLSLEQRKAVLGILNGSDISILEGLPGSGKTLAMKEIVKQYKNAGFRVIGTSTSSAASLNLAAVTGIEAKNITLWRKEWQKRKGRKFEMALRADYYTEEQYSENDSSLSANDILIIDEAGMVELASMDYMLSMVRKSGAKVILVGDSNQFAAVGMTGALRKAAHVVGSYKLSNVQRQYNDEEKKATVLLGEYKVAEALEIYEQQGCFSISDNAEGAESKLVDDYVDFYIERARELQKDDLAAIKSVAICTFTNKAANKLNGLVREKLKGAGIIKGQGQFFRVGGKSMELNFGEQIVFEANNYQYGVLNGEVGTVVSFKNPDKLGYGLVNILVHKADGSKSLIEIDTKDKGLRLNYGYAVTAYKLQGASVDQVLVHYGPEVGYEAFNVMMTRHKEKVTLYAAKKELEDNVYKRLDLDINAARGKYEINANEELWRVGLFIGVSKRVNDSFASDYISMGESSNDLVLKSYIESSSNVIKYLREIDIWQQNILRNSGTRPLVWEHPSWDKVLHYKEVRDGDAEIIVKNYLEFEGRIKQLEINYATILKHASKSPYYFVEAKELENTNTLESNEHYSKMLTLVEELKEVMSDTSQDTSFTTEGIVNRSVVNKYDVNEEGEVGVLSIKDQEIKKTLSRLRSSYRKLNEDLKEKQVSIELLQSEVSRLEDYEQLLKAKVKSCKEYQDKLFPEFLKRVYQDSPEEVLKSWEELKKAEWIKGLEKTQGQKRKERKENKGEVKVEAEVMSKTLAKVRENPEILGKLLGYGIGNIQGFEPRRINAIANIFDLARRLQNFEDSKLEKKESLKLLFESKFFIRRSQMKNAIEDKKLGLVEQAKIETEFMRLIEEITKVKSKDYAKLHNLLRVHGSVIEEASLSYKSYNGSSSKDHNYNYLEIKPESTSVIDNVTSSNNNDISAGSKFGNAISSDNKQDDNRGDGTIGTNNNESHYQKWVKRCEKIIDISKTPSKSYMSKYRSARSAEQKISFAEVSSYLGSSHYEELFRKYANSINGDGSIRKQGNKISCGSLNMDLSTGLWIRFSSNNGGDIFHFISESLGIDKKRALEHIAGLYGISSSKINEASWQIARHNYKSKSDNYKSSDNTQEISITKEEKGDIKHAVKAKVNDWVAMEVIPISAPIFDKDCLLVKNLAKENEVLEIYNYHNIDDELIGATIRCKDKVSGKKQVLPASFCYNEFKEMKQWRLKGFTDDGYKPIYGVQKLKEVDKPVLIVEGEKTASKASELLPEYIVISWLGGSSSASKADWSILRNKEVVIWPDLDEQGIKAAREIAIQINLVNNHSGMVTIIDPNRLEFGGKVYENLLPDKWDLADELPKGVYLTNIKEAISNSRRDNRSITRAIELTKEMANEITRELAQEQAKEIVNPFITELRNSLLSESAERIIWQKKSYRMILSKQEVINLLEKEVALEEWLSSKEVIEYARHAKARGVLEGGHDFLGLEHVLYRKLLICCLLDTKDSNIIKINISLLAKASGINLDHYARSQTRRSLLENMEENYQAKVKNLYIHPDHYKEYEERISLTYDNDRLELYKILIKDITLLHKKQLGHNLTKSHHDKIAKDVYDIVTTQSYEYTQRDENEHKNAYKNKHDSEYKHEYKSPNKQYSLASSDKIIIADNVYQKMTSLNWWQDFCKNQLSISNDKIAEIESINEDKRLSKIGEVRADIARIFSVHENLVKSIKDLAPSYNIEKIKERIQSVTFKENENRTDILKKAALDVFKDYIKPYLQQIAEEKSKVKTTNEIFKVLKKEKDFCCDVYNKYPDLVLMLKEDYNNDHLYQVANTSPKMIFQIKQNISNIERLGITLSFNVFQELKKVNENAQSLNLFNNKLYEICHSYLSKQAELDLEKIKKTGAIIVDSIRFTDKSSYFEYVMLDPAVKLYLSKSYEHISTYRGKSNSTKSMFMKRAENHVHELFFKNKLYTEDKVDKEKANHNNSRDGSKDNDDGKDNRKDDNKSNSIDFRTHDISAELSKTMEDLGIDCNEIFKRALDHYLEYQNYSLNQKFYKNEQLKNIIRRAEFEQVSFKKWKYYLKSQLKNKSRHEQIETIASVMELEVTADKMAKMHSGLYYLSDKACYMQLDNNKDLCRVIEYFANKRENWNLQENRENGEVEEVKEAQENRESKENREEKIKSLLEDHDKVTALSKVNKSAARFLASQVADYEVIYTSEMLTPQRLVVMTQVATPQAKLADKLLLKGGLNDHNHISATPLSNISTDNAGTKIEHKDELKVVEFTAVRLERDMTNDILLKASKEGYNAAHDIYYRKASDHLHASHSHTREEHSNYIEEHIHDVINLSRNIHDEYNREIEQQRQQQKEISRQHGHSIEMDF